MRKTIMLIAAVSLVCLVAINAGARLEQALGVPQNFDINLTVPHWAVMERTVDQFDLTFTDLDHDNAIAVSNTGRITLRSNAAISVVLEQDWSGVARDLGITEEALLWGGSGDKDYVISPNIIVQPLGQHNMTDFPGTDDNQGWYNSPKFTFNAGRGTNAFNIRMDARVNDANPRWTYLTPGTHTANLIMTISGQQTQ